MKLATAIGFAAAVSVLALGERAANACPGCSNPNLPSARAGVLGLTPGELAVAFNLTATTMHVVHPEACPDIGPICNVRDEPAQLHDQRFYIAELRPVVGLGLTRNFGAELQAPVRVVKTTITFRRLDGTVFEPDYENIHHRNETLAGVADPWLMMRASGTIRDFAVTSRVGLGLPLGKTEPDPFARARAGLSHEHIQFGTGTLYPVYALDASLKLGDARVSGYAQALIFPYDNGYGYRAGNRFSGGLAGDYEIVPKLRAGLTTDVLNEQPERWGGVIQQDGNVGRTDLLIGANASYLVGDVALGAYVKVPVWQHLIETHSHDDSDTQLTYPAIVGLSIATSFWGDRSRSPSVPASGVLPNPE